MWGVGKRGVDMIWLKTVTFLSLKKSQVVWLNFSVCNYSLKYTHNFRENGGKILGPAVWSLCDAKRPLAMSCKSAHCKADIMSSQLCALCSQFLATIECQITVHAKCQGSFKISVKCTYMYVYIICVYGFKLCSTVKFNKWRNWTTCIMNHSDMQHGLAKISFHVQWWTVSTDTLVAFFF
jgi:hypothetical protein